MPSSEPEPDLPQIEDKLQFLRQCMEEMKEQLRKRKDQKDEFIREIDQKICDVQSAVYYRDSNQTSSADLEREIKSLEKETPKAARYLTSEECSALLAACPDHLYPIVVLALNTGMRKGELLHLQWEDVDFRRETITVRNRRDFHTKNYEDRVIPMNNEVRETLRRLSRHIRSPYVFPSIADPEGNAYNDTTAVKQSGIGHVRFHDLRHTFASHLVMAGVDIRTVQTLLGHKDISTTMRYAHLAPGHLKGAVERLDFSHGYHMDTTDSRSPLA